MHAEEIISLAKKTIEEYVINKKIIDIPEDLSSDLVNRRAGVFVTLKKNGKLRGCIGTIEAIEENIAREIIRNGISAANYDPRFPGVKADELDKLEYSVDILGKKEKIDSKKELDLYKYGVIVEQQNKRGLLLPNLEGVNTVDEQINIARQKAAIAEGADYNLYRFKVERYK